MRLYGAFTGLWLLGCVALGCSSQAESPAAAGAGGLAGSLTAGSGGSGGAGLAGSGGNAGAVVAGTGGAGQAGTGGATDAADASVPRDASPRSDATDAAQSLDVGYGDRAEVDRANVDAPAGDAAPSSAAVIAVMRKANDYFMAKWPDPSAPIVTNQSRPSHIWTRAVYYEGLMALRAVDAEQASKYDNYAVAWAESHSWGLNGGATTRSADNQCAGQTYIDLYKQKADAVRIRDIKASVDAMVASQVVNDWFWIDALQMAMPVFTRLGVLYPNGGYFEKMYALYANAKNVEGGKGLYNGVDHLWWRDKDFVSPYVEPNGSDCHWSRGNGWVYAALARVLDLLPTNEAHRAEYLADFVAMSAAIKSVQRSDGFWNVSLHDPTHFGGKELTGTALFTYGMAWGIRKGILPASDYSPIVDKAWNAMVSDAVHPNGFLGWVQGSGKQPSDGQPLSYDKVPDFEDYGLGCFLLAGSEVAQAR